MSSTSKRVLDFITEYLTSNSYAPTIREIATGLSLSTSTVHHHLGRLEHAGRISRARYAARTITVLL